MIPSASAIQSCQRGANSATRPVEAVAKSASGAFAGASESGVAAVPATWPTRTLSRQKASIGFEATLQVRNKLLAAYKDIVQSLQMTPPSAKPTQ